MHTQHVHFCEVCLGLLMRFRFIGFRPLHLFSLFILSPSHTFVFLVFFMSFCLHVLSFHPFFRLRTHRPWPWCVRAHLHTLSAQVSGRPGFDNEVGFISCPCALGFLFIATTHTFVPSCPPSHVFIPLSLLRAHFHNRPSLNFLCLPSGGACVCNLWSHKVPVGLFLLIFQQGGARGP